MFSQTCFAAPYKSFTRTLVVLVALFLCVLHNAYPFPSQAPITFNVYQGPYFSFAYPVDWVLSERDGQVMIAPASNASLPEAERAGILLWFIQPSDRKVNPDGMSLAKLKESLREKAAKELFLHQYYTNSRIEIDGYEGTRWHGDNLDSRWHYIVTAVESPGGLFFSSSGLPTSRDRLFKPIIMTILKSVEFSGSSNPEKFNDHGRAAIKKAPDTAPSSPSLRNHLTAGEVAFIGRFLLGKWAGMKLGEIPGLNSILTDFEFTFNPDGTYHYHLKSKGTLRPDELEHTGYYEVRPPKSQPGRNAPYYVTLVLTPTRVLRRSSYDNNERELMGNSPREFYIALDFLVKWHISADRDINPDNSGGWSIQR